MKNNYGKYAVHILLCCVCLLSCTACVNKNQKTPSEVQQLLKNKKYTLNIKNSSTMEISGNGIEITYFIDGTGSEHYTFIQTSDLETTYQYLVDDKQDEKLAIYKECFINVKVNMPVDNTCSDEEVKHVETFLNTREEAYHDMDVTEEDLIAYFQYYIHL